MKKKFFLIVLALFLGIKTVFAQDGCWTTKKDMNARRSVLSVCSVNGVIYAIGGSMSAYTSTSTVEAYYPTEDSWTIKAALPQKLCGSTASAVNNRIYVIGGSTSMLGTGYVVDSVYEYNPVLNSWSRKSNIPIPLAFAAADVVGGKIYVIGGAPFGMNSAYNSVYEYNPATDTWTKKSDMPTARFLASATAVDGKIYVFGGAANINGEGFSVVEVYDPYTDTWTVKRSMPIRRCTHTSSAINGNIYIFTGGLRMATIYNDVLEYNPTLDTLFTKTSIPTPRVAPAACSIGGKIYIFGGMDIDNHRLSTVEEYDPALDTTNIVSIKDGSNSEIPETIKLEQNYPNPFNPATTISYSIPSTSHVRLSVFNILGQEVAVLINEVRETGFYNVEFSGVDLASGLYFYRLSTENFTQIKKMLLVK